MGIKKSNNENESYGFMWSTVGQDLSTYKCMTSIEITLERYSQVTCETTTEDNNAFRPQKS